VPQLLTRIRFPAFCSCLLLARIFDECCWISLISSYGAEINPTINNSSEPRWTDTHTHARTQNQMLCVAQGSWLIAWLLMVRTFLRVTWFSNEDNQTTDLFWFSTMRVFSEKNFLESVLLVFFWPFEDDVSVRFPACGALLNWYTPISTFTLPCAFEWWVFQGQFCYWQIMKILYLSDPHTQVFVSFILDPPNAPSLPGWFLPAKRSPLPHHPPVLYSMMLQHICYSWNPWYCWHNITKIAEFFTCCVFVSFLCLFHVYCV